MGVFAVTALNSKAAKEPLGKDIRAGGEPGAVPGEEIGASEKES